MQKSTVKKENYSVSLIAGISFDRIIATQLIEGGVTSHLFESFIQ